jgi:hypothetical protein
MTFTEILYGIIFLPVSTLKHISSSKPWLQGILVFSIVVLFNLIIGLGIDRINGVYTVNNAYLQLYLLIGLILSIAAIIVLAAIFNFFSDLIYHKSNLRGIISSLTFAFVPAVLGPSLEYAVIIIKGMNINFSVIIIVWVIVLQIIGIRETYLIDTGQAVLMLLLPLIILVGLGTLVAVLTIVALPGLI